MAYPVLTWKDRIKVASATTGTGTLTLGAAAAGYRTFAAGDDGKVFAYVIEDGTAWETGYGTYTHSGTTFARTTRKDSSTGSAISCSGAEYLFVDVIASAIDDGLGDYVSILQKDPIAITGTATATINRMHYCSGTSADYTLTLPAVSGNDRKHVGILVLDAMTKILTVDGSGSETINGALTRIMWKGEVAVLECRESAGEWVRVGGRSIAMCATLTRATDQIISAGTWTAVAFTSVVSGMAQMFDAGNARASIIRPSLYEAVGLMYMTGVTTDTTCFGMPVANAVTPPGSAQQIPEEGNGAQGGATMPAVLLAAGDYINLSVYGGTITVLTVKSSINPAYLAVKEILQW